jgi:hypothetical protein
MSMLNPKVASVKEAIELAGAPVRSLPACSSVKRPKPRQDGKGKGWLSAGRMSLKISGKISGFLDSRITPSAGASGQ